MRRSSMPRLTDEQVELVVARERPVEDATLRELAAFVDATRELCLEPEPPAFAERQMAMIVAASQSVQGADARARPPREHRLGLPPRARHWGAALAAFVLALVVAGVLLLAGSGDQHAKRVTDRAGPAQSPDRAVPLKPTFRPPPPTQPRRDDTPRAGSRSRERPSALPPSAPAPATPHSAEPDTHAGLPPNAPTAPSEPPVERAPVGGPERPTDPDPQPRPYRGYGGPDSEPTPLKGPLDTEQPIPISP
jgi:hypothetical protein